MIPLFGIYLFTGLLCWNLFTDIIGGCTGSIVGNAGLVKKVYFPRELFPLSVIGAACGQLPAAVRGPPRRLRGHRPLAAPDDLLLVPLALLVLLVFGTALGLILAATNVYLRDVAVPRRGRPAVLVLDDADRLPVDQGPGRACGHVSTGC